MDAQRRSKVLLAWCEGITAERSERVAADVTRVHPPLGQARRNSQIVHANMHTRARSVWSCMWVLLPRATSNSMLHSMRCRCCKRPGFSLQFTLIRGVSRLLCCDISGPCKYLIGMLKSCSVQTSCVLIGGRMCYMQAVLALCADPALDLPPGIGLPPPRAAPPPSLPQASNGYLAPRGAGTGGCGLVLGAQLLPLQQGFAGASMWSAAAVTAGTRCPGTLAGVAGPEAVGGVAPAGLSAPVLVRVELGLGLGAPMSPPVGSLLAAQLAGPSLLCEPLGRPAGHKDPATGPAGAAGPPAPHAEGAVGGRAIHGYSPAQMDCGPAPVAGIGSGGALLQALQLPPEPAGHALCSPGQALPLPASAADGAPGLPPPAIPSPGPSPSPGVRLQAAAVPSSERREDVSTNQGAGPVADGPLPAMDPSAACMVPGHAALGNVEGAAAQKSAPAAQDLALPLPAAESLLPASADGGRSAHAGEGKRAAAIEQEVGPEQQARTILVPAGGVEGGLGGRAASGQGGGVSAVAPIALAGAKRRASECGSLQAEPDVAAKRARLLALRCAPQLRMHAYTWMIRAIPLRTHIDSASVVAVQLQAALLLHEVHRLTLLYISCRARLQHAAHIIYTYQPVAPGRAGAMRR